MITPGHTSCLATTPTVCVSIQKHGPKRDLESCQFMSSQVELGERIGGGGVGVVYQGWLGEKAVALKTLVSTGIARKGR
jgi:hypothetical protein